MMMTAVSRTPVLAVDDEEKKEWEEEKRREGCTLWGPSEMLN